MKNRPETGAQPSRWANLITEQQNPNSANLDALALPNMLTLMNNEDRRVPEAVGEVLADITQAVELVVTAFRNNGRLFYIGAGTSGRLGVLDASECPPTFGVEPEMVQGLIAGGPPALTRSQEGAEDRAEDGAAELLARKIQSNDVVMGIAASGVTPYVLGALDYANRTGCATVFFTCNPSAAERVQAHVKIVPRVGPELLTGSTRLKAGTATKLVLNMITTAAMVQMGKVFGNLMVDLTPSCAKLQDRAQRILYAAAGLSKAQSQQALEQAGGNLKIALVMTKRAVSKETARRLLEKNKGQVRAALEDPASN
ncbi:MAG: N-acetylmuramic acid 6-phosphate etherase [bacterium]|nr:N-acetylmuramic acid 6-phosphate etherase [bacterium]